MLVVAAATAWTVGSIIGVAIGTAFTSARHKEIVSKLQERNQNMSKNFDKRVGVLEEKYSSVNKKLEEEKTRFEEEKTKLKEEKMELIRRFDNSQQEILSLMKEMAEERKEYQGLVNKIEQERDEMRSQQDMILSFLNKNPALQTVVHRLQQKAYQGHWVPLEHRVYMEQMTI